MGNVNLTVPNDWSAQAQDIERRRRMAEMLQAQSMQPAERFSTNGIEAPISWTQGLAKMLQAYMGGKGQRDATDAQKALGQSYQAASTADVMELAKALKAPARAAVPERAPMLDPQETEQMADNPSPMPANIPAQPAMLAGQLDENIIGNMRTDQGRQAALAQLLSQVKPKDPIKLGKDETLLDPRTFNPLAKGMSKPAEHVINGKIYQNVDGVLKEVGGPGVPNDPNRPFNADGTPNTGFQQYSKELKVLGAPRTTVSVDNRALGQYADKVGGKSAEMDIEQLSVAQGARENAEKLDKTISLLKKEDAITGMGADILKNVERAKVLFANDKKAGKKVSDTEYLNALLGSDVFPMIKELGIGARGLDTPAEREFLREVMSGTINMNKDTLIRLTQVRRDIAQRSMDRWNKRVKSGELDDFFKYANRPKETIDYQPSSSNGEWAVVK